MDFDGSAVEASLGDIAGFAFEGAVGEHGVFSGDPAAFDVLGLHPFGCFFFEEGAADDLGVAEADEDGVRCEVGFDGDFAKFIGFAVVRSLEWNHGNGIIVKY